jgi:DNA repair protein RadC
MTTTPIAPVTTIDLSSAELLTEHEDYRVSEAIAILERRLFQRDSALGNPNDDSVESALCNSNDVRQYLRLKLMSKKREIFALVFCDAGHRPIAFEPLSCGTLTHASVYPREVLERVLFHNAAAIILAHNNPSGRTEPSLDDRKVTACLRDLFALIDVRVLDHVIIGKGTPFSFADAGLL